MASSFEVVIEGPKEMLARLKDAPDKVQRAIAQAVNKTTRDGRVSAARQIRRQVNFPARYLAPSDGRLTVTKFATASDPEGRITARSRGTSLARFVTGNLQPGKRGGVTVSVKPGTARFMGKAFAIRLRRGDADVSAENFNMGLAIRLRPGEVIHNKKQLATRATGGKSSVYLLYGPSVDQVFKAVREDLVPDLEQALADEFFRVLEL